MLNFSYSHFDLINIGITNKAYFLYYFWYFNLLFKHILKIEIYISLYNDIF